MGAAENVLSRLLRPKRKVNRINPDDECERQEESVKQAKLEKMLKQSQSKGPDPRHAAFLSKLAQEKLEREQAEREKQEKAERKRESIKQAVRARTREDNAKRQERLEEERRLQEEQQRLQQEEALRNAPKVSVVPSVWKKHVEKEEKDESKAHDLDRGLDRARWAQKHGVAPETPVFICSKGFPAVRDELLRRGWCENPDPESHIWDLKYSMYMKAALDKDSYGEGQILNRFLGTGEMCTKGGIARNLESLRWFEETDSKEFFPRCYNVSGTNGDSEIEAFAEDFCVTGAERLLKRLRQEFSERQEARNE
jgi:hypothetical protein